MCMCMYVSARVNETVNVHVSVRVHASVRANANVNNRNNVNLSLVNGRVLVKLSATGHAFSPNTKLRRG